MRTVAATLTGLMIASSLVLAQAPDPKKVEAGQKAYEAQKCATCHSIKGVGGKLSTDLAGVGAKFTEADIRKWLTDPAPLEAKLPKKPVMPMSTFLKSHKLSDPDVDALVAYMMSLK
jgi:mono/diheme cytochrome c family protein